MRAITPLLVTLIVLLNSTLSFAQSSQPIEQRENKLPHVEVDVPNHRVRVDCEMLGIDAPLEFLVVRSGTNEHESVLRTPAKPSHVHFALIMIGLAQGEPVRYDEAKKQWFPPHGGAIEIMAEWTDREGKKHVVPAARLMREVKSKKPMPDHAWIFAGSKVMEDGTYAADVTGYVVSVVNFELSLIDIPELASNANETLMWQIDKDASPPPGTKVALIFEPSKKQPSTQPTTQQGSRASANDARIDVATVKVSSDGAIELGDEDVSSVDQLIGRLKKMQKDRPVRVRIAAADPNSDLAKQINAAVRNAGIDSEPAQVAQNAEPHTIEELEAAIKDLEARMDRSRQQLEEVKHRVKELKEKR